MMWMSKGMTERPTVSPTLRDSVEWTIQVKFSVLTMLGTPMGIQCAIVAVPVSVIAILVVSAITKPKAELSLEALYKD